MPSARVGSEAAAKAANLLAGPPLMPQGGNPLDYSLRRRPMQAMWLRAAIMQTSEALSAIAGQPLANCARADAYGLRDALRRLPALDLQYNPLSTARRQPGIPMHVHPVLPWNLKL
jgi:hypothetical protein